jgi:hypothetical protein
MGFVALTTYAPSIRETIVIKEDHVVGMVQMFKSSNDFDFHANSNKQAWAQILGSGSKMIMSTSIPKGGMTNFQHIVAPREVSFESLVLDMCNPFPN